MAIFVGALEADIRNLAL